MEMLPAGGWADVATKSDIAASMTAVKADLAIMKSDLTVQGRELRAEIAGVECRLGSRIDANGQQLRLDLAQSQLRMLRWMITTILGCSTVIVVASALIR